MFRGRRVFVAVSIHPIIARIPCLLPSHKINRRFLCTLIAFDEAPEAKESNGSPPASPPNPQTGSNQKAAAFKRVSLLLPFRDSKKEAHALTPHLLLGKNEEVC